MLIICFTDNRMNSSGRFYCFIFSIIDMTGHKISASDVYNDLVVCHQ